MPPEIDWHLGLYHPLVVAGGRWLFSILQFGEVAVRFEPYIRVDYASISSYEQLGPDAHTGIEAGNEEVSRLRQEVKELESRVKEMSSRLSESEVRNLSTTQKVDEVWSEMRYSQADGRPRSSHRSSYRGADSTLGLYDFVKHKSPPNFGEHNPSAPVSERNSSVRKTCQLRWSNMVKLGELLGVRSNNGQKEQKALA
eukprot:768388-Hanusia_phi.AAC.5